MALIVQHKRAVFMGDEQWCLSAGACIVTKVEYEAGGPFHLVDGDPRTGGILVFSSVNPTAFQYQYPLMHAFFSRGCYQIGNRWGEITLQLPGQQGLVDHIAHIGDDDERKCVDCGATFITTRIEDVFGDRYLVEHCEDCGHEDEWLLGDGDDEAAEEFHSHADE